MNVPLPITVVVAVKDEERNIARCLQAVGSADRIIVVDSNSKDATANIARAHHAEVVQFHYTGGYPKKRQWALNSLHIVTPWVLLLDADEVVPQALWKEIGDAIQQPAGPNAFFITKGVHFMGRRLRFGGFSYAGVLLFRTGMARFEHLMDDPVDAQDMEIHERLIVNGAIGRLQTPLIHEDFKGLESYIDRHNKYSTWEARLRFSLLQTGHYGIDTIEPRLFGNAQERRRFLKTLIIRLPFEQQVWFCYHYFLRLGFLEGRPGLIASQLRAAHIANVRAKVYELRSRNPNPKDLGFFRYASRILQLRSN